MEYCLKEEKLKKGFNIYNEGDETKFLYFIVDGVVQLSFSTDMTQLLEDEQKLLEKKKGFFNLSEYKRKKTLIKTKRKCH